MPVTDESRHRLHQKLDQTIGEEDATTLMEHLPPVGWADVATKTDLDRLRDHDIVLVRNDIEGLDVRVRGEIEGLGVRTTSGFDAVSGAVAQVGKDVAALGKRIDESDRRLEGLMTRVDHFFWHVTALLGTIGLILIGVAQIRGR